jgi:hypothetical protein
MTKYLLIDDFQPGVAEGSLEDWQPAEVEAHLDYYRVLLRERQGDTDGAIAAYREAARLATNLAEQRHLAGQAARLRASAGGQPGR